MCLINSNPFLDGSVLPIDVDDARRHSYGGVYMRNVLSGMISTLTLKQYTAKRMGLCADDACMLERLLTAKAYIELLYNQNAQYACWTTTVGEGNIEQTEYKVKDLMLSDAERKLLTCLLKGTGMDSTNFAPFYTSKG